MTRPGGPARRAALAAAATLLAAGCTTSVVAGHGQPAGRSATPRHGPAPASRPQPPARFTDCRSLIDVALLGLPARRLAKLRFGCARISVPLDYADPDGRQIHLQLIRIHDTANRAHTGSLLVNPGGPGGSGVEAALDLAGRISDAVLTHFDLIGFDPRGVNLSTPVDCQSDEQEARYTAASPDVGTAAGFARATALARQYATECADKYGPALADFNTVQTAKDMDRIRQAVGDPRLNYLGFSYGTEIGAQYIHLFPGRVRAAVLDGPIDPLGDYRTMLTRQLQGFDASFTRFAAWCAGHDPCRTVGDPRRAVQAVVAAARRSPIPSSTGTRAATPDLLLTGVNEALYSRQLWPALGTALRAARSGDGSGLLQLADRYYERFGGHYSNLLDMYNVVECNDSPPGPSDAVMHATTRDWLSRYPLFAQVFVPQLLLCQQWRARRTVPPLPTAPSTPGKILVVGNLHDPATPYQGAKDLTRTLGNADLLSWDGDGHTSYLEGSSCIDDAVNRYLISTATPSPDTTCPP